MAGVHLIFALIFSLSVSDFANALEAFNGKVVGVVDGAIDVLHSGRAERIRLSGIDSPERGQPYYKGAKRFLSEMVFSREVIVIPKSRDRYGRTIADVTFTNGLNINQRIVKDDLPRNSGHLEKGEACSSRRWSSWVDPDERLLRNLNARP